MKGRHFLYSYLLCSLIAGTLSAQSIKVVDEKQIPLIGVHVYGYDGAGISDIEGVCPVHWSSEGDTLILDYLGYKEVKIITPSLDEILLVEMMPNNEVIDEVIIVGRLDARDIDLPYAINRIKSEEIFKHNIQNSADALELGSAAYVQRSQLGGGSPVLRGFEANKVLLVVDGVRLNNAIYRNGHLQNAITIDPAILEQVEVIYGAGSLLYGSEALGGVIHYRTKSPLLAFSAERDGRHEINAYTRYNSADQERAYHLDHTYSRRRFGILTSFSSSSRGDLRAGRQRSEAYPDFGRRTFFVRPAPVLGQADEIITNTDDAIQVGTGYTQWDFTQKYVFDINTEWRTTLNLQYSTSNDVPRYDNLIEVRNGQPRFAEWFYGPQDRLLISPRLDWHSNKPLFDKVTLIASYQNIEESRITRAFNQEIRESQIEDVDVYGVTLDLTKRLSPSQKLTYGADLHYNNVTSTAFGESSDVIAPILTRYPSAGSQLTNYGVYTQHNWQNQDSSIVWINGLRWSGQRTSLLFSREDPIVWPEHFYEGITNPSSALVGISGLNIKSGPYVAKLSTGTAFRSPNVDDLAKIRINRDEITVPNPELAPERVWNNEITIGYQSPHITIGLTGFYTRLSNAIVRANFTLPDGSPIFFNGIDTLDVTANINSESGRVRGISAQFKTSYKHFALDAGFNVQSGLARDSEGNEAPLGHIPPIYGHTKLTYDKGSLSLFLRHRYNGWKRIEDFGGSVDNPELATVDGSPSWHIFGVGGSFLLPYNLTLNLALENIADLHYRPFASGLSGAGRHVVIGLRYSGGF